MIPRISTAVPPMIIFPAAVPVFSVIPVPIRLSTNTLGSLGIGGQSETVPPIFIAVFRSIGAEVYIPFLPSLQSEQFTE